MALATPEPEDNRILKWSEFHSEKSLDKLSMEQRFQLQKILIDIKKPFSQAENILSPSDKTAQQLVADLCEFTTEVVSSLFAQHKGEVAILRKMTEASLQDSMNASIELSRQLNNDGE